jgi:hypothetical protein
MSDGRCPYCGGLQSSAGACSTMNCPGSFYSGLHTFPSSGAPSPVMPPPSIVGAPCPSCASSAQALADAKKEVERLTAERDALLNTVRSQRRELTNKDATLKQRTLDLDAMGFVWCDGGCASGVYQKPGHEHLRPLTREMALRALRAAVRIGRKFGSTVEWKEMEESERVCMRAKEVEVGSARWALYQAEAALAGMRRERERAVAEAKVLGMAEERAEWCGATVLSL